MKSKVKWMAEQLVVRLNNDFQVTRVTLFALTQKLRCSFKFLTCFCSLPGCRSLSAWHSTHLLMTWGDPPLQWRCWRVTTAWSLTASAGSPRSSLRSRHWRDTSNSGGRWTARSSGLRPRCQGLCKSCRVGRSLFTPWASRLSWGWKSSSICCWKTWTSWRRAERRSSFCKAGLNFGSLCIGYVWLCLPKARTDFCKVFWRTFMLEKALIYMHMYLFMYCWEKICIFKHCHKLHFIALCSSQTVNSPAYS